MTQKAKYHSNAGTCFNGKWYNGIFARWGADVVGYTDCSIAAGMHTSPVVGAPLQDPCREWVQAKPGVWQGRFKAADASERRQEATFLESSVCRGERDSDRGAA